MMGGWNENEVPVKKFKRANLQPKPVLFTVTLKVNFK